MIELKSSVDLYGKEFKVNVSVKEKYVEDDKNGHIIAEAIMSRKKYEKLLANLELQIYRMRQLIVPN